jgi:hypothetical protein
LMALTSLTSMGTPSFESMGDFKPINPFCGPHPFEGGRIAQLPEKELT